MPEPSASTTSPTTGPLRVLTVNIHKGYTAFNRRFVLRELREAVRAVGSDLVFIQEVRGATTPGSPGPFAPGHSTRTVRNADSHEAFQTHYEYLADQIWASHAFGRNAVADGHDHGNALLSRHPIVHWANHDVSLPGEEPRGLLHCVIRTDGRPPLAPLLHGVCVHLGLREWQRRHQLDRLVALIAAEVPPDAPLVVAGDFNDWRSRADAVLRAAGLSEVFAAVEGHHARSFPAAWPLLRLDRIYVRRVRRAVPLPLPRHPWAALSDHAPLAAELLL